MKPIRPLRIGMIGCGHIAQSQHLPALRWTDGIRVAAAADLDAANLRYCQTKFHIPDVYSDYRALLEDRRIEAVAVCVPVQLHAEIALASLAAGKHLLVEKPLALDLEGCRRIIDAAESSGLTVLMGFNLRWHRLVRKAVTIMKRGDLGPIQMVQSLFTCQQDHGPDGGGWRRRRGAGGGTLIEMGVHLYDLWRLLLGSEIEELFVAARSESMDDETTAVTARMSDGVIATGALSENTASDVRLEIFGHRGVLQLSLTRFDGLRILPRGRLPGDVSSYADGVWHRLKALPGLSSRRPYPSDWAAAFGRQWSHFLNVIEGREHPGCSLQDGLQATKAALAATRSADAGIPLRIDGLE